MKKVIVASKRLTREFIENPHQNVSYQAKVQRSNCTDFSRNSIIIDYGNGYSKIVAKPKET